MQANTNHHHHHHPFILTAAAILLVTSAFAVSSTTSVPFQSSAAAPDRCISVGYGGGTRTGCVYSPDDKELSKELIKSSKEECQQREEVDYKCSSSQTGYGEFDNWKPKKD